MFFADSYFARCWKTKPNVKKQTCTGKSSHAVPKNERFTVEV